MRRASHASGALSRGRFAWAFSAALALASGDAWAVPPDGFKVGPAPAWAAHLELDLSAPRAGDVESGRACLLTQGEDRVGPSGVESYFRQAWRIVSQPGLDAASRIEIDFDATYQSLVLHFVRVRRDGATLDRLDPSAVKIVQREANLERQIYDGRRSAVLFVPDLRVGDVLEYAYTTHGADPTLGDKYEGRILLGMPEPVGHMYGRVMLPKGRSVRVSTHGPHSADVDPATRETAYGTELSWDRVAPPPYPIEPDTPASFVPLPYAVVSEYASWREVADQGRRLFRTAPLTAKTRAVIDGWRREAKSRDEFILRAVRFVQDEVRYVGIEVGLGRRQPADPDAVFERRFGDCKDKSALLAALLAAGGVPAVPALVTSSRSPSLDDDEPDFAAFDHAIVRVGPIEGVTYWVDATASGQGGGLERLRWSDLRWTLPLADGTTALERLSPEPHDGPDIQVDETFVLPATPDAEGQLDVARTYERAAADGARQRLAAFSEDQRSKYYRGLNLKPFPEARERSPVECADDRDADRIRVVAHYALPHVYTPIDAGRRLEFQTLPGLLDELLQEPATIERKTPLRALHPLRVRETTAIQVPTKLTLEPQDVAVEDVAFAFHFTSSKDDQTVRYSYDLASKTDTVAPAELAEHAAAVRKARAVLARSLKLPVLGPDGPNWPMIAASAVLLPLLGFAGFRAYRYEPPAQKRRRRQPPMAIGGLLLLVALRLVVSPFVMISGLRHFGWMFSRRSWSLLADSDVGHQQLLAYACAVEAPALAALALYTVILFALFLQRKRSFPVHFVPYTAMVLAVAAVDLVGLTGDEAAREKSVSQFVVTSVTAVLLLLYVRTSRRVAATFVRGSGSRGGKPLRRPPVVEG